MSAHDEQGGLGSPEEEDGELTKQSPINQKHQLPVTSPPPPALMSPGMAPVGTSPQPEVLGHTCRVRCGEPHVWRYRNEPPE